MVSDSGATVSITRRPSRIGPQNVSAVPCFAVAISAEELAEVLQQQASVEEPLLAAVLVR